MHVTTDAHGATAGRVIIGDGERWSVESQVGVLQWSLQPSRQQQHKSRDNMPY